ncbi:hypothetical protein BaRGS_00017964 [Batillaria attramentaria]|uniref:Uncharacterized protein n=1 Tax=Batillaria attramentaria TaxID=370345 RepID=A0ABD0KVB4_9CAEN
MAALARAEATILQVTPLSLSLVNPFSCSVSILRSPPHSHCVNSRPETSVREVKVGGRQYARECFTSIFTHHRSPRPRHHRNRVSRESTELGKAIGTILRVEATAIASVQEFP